LLVKDTSLFALVRGKNEVASSPCDQRRRRNYLQMSNMPPTTANSPLFAHLHSPSANLHSLLFLFHLILSFVMIRTHPAPLRPPSISARILSAFFLLRVFVRGLVPGPPLV